MRLEDMLKNVSGITNKVIKENCWEGQFNVLEGVQTLQSKINEIIVAINNGIIKGDKGDTPNVQVGETTTLDPNSKAIVTQTGDILNPILNFGIPKGDKGDKGDTGKASESIQDNVVGLDTCWSSEKTVGYVDNMINSLQDVKGVKYETDSNYKVMTGTKNGVVKDLKISGRSLVNLGGKVNITTDIYKPLLIGNISMFKNSQKYTFIIKNVLQHAVKIYTNEYQFSSNPRFKIIEPNSTLVFTDTTLDTLKPNDNVILKAGVEQSAIYSLEVVILEGDHTQNPPNGYFEGIASVGNGNEIEVLSRKEDGNLFDGELELGDINSEGKLIVNSAHVRNKNNITVLPQTKYYFYLDSTIVTKYKVVYCYDNKNQFIKFIDIFSDSNKSFVTPENCSFIKFKLEGGANINGKIFIGSQNLKINFNSVLKQDKKPILFKDTDGTWKPVTELRGIDLNRCDTIEEHSDGKHYLHVRTIPISINNSNDWLKFDTVKYSQFYIQLSNDLAIDNKETINVISDKYKSCKYWDREREGFLDSCFASNTILAILKPLGTSIESFKSEISSGVNFIYQLAQEKVYEVNPLDLQSFENETMILFKYGVINGLSQFYVDSNLGSITLDNINRLSRLENEVFQVKKLILNGDYRTLAESTYPNDFKEVNNE